MPSPDPYDEIFAGAVQRMYGGQSAASSPALAAQSLEDPYDAAFQQAVLTMYGKSQAAAPPKVSAAEQIANDEITRGAKALPGQGSDALGGVSQAVLNILAGGIRGAGSIGATVMRVLPNALGGDTAAENKERRDRIDENMEGMGAQTDSLAYKGGKLAAEVAGTSGAGSAVAAPLRAVSGLAARAGAGAIPALDTAATALASSGFQTGAKLGTVADLATRAAAGAATGAVSAGMVNPDDAGTGAAVGALVPGGVTVLGAADKAIRRGMREILGAASPEVRDLALRAEQLGIRVPADRIVDSKTLDAMASSLNYVPLSGRTATEAKMVEQMNRAVSRTFGQDNPNIVQALKQAQLKLGSQFDSFLKSNAVKVDQQFMDDLANVATDASQALTDDAAAVVNRQIDNIISKVRNGEIPADAAYNIKRTLDKIGRQGTPQGHYALDLKGVLMDALNRSVGPQEASKFAKLRQQYGNMLAVEKLGPANGVEGEISAAKLANARNLNNKDLQEVADIAAQFLKPRESMHSAGQRISIGTAAAIGGGQVGGLAGAALGAGGLMAAGRAANAVLNSDAARNAAMRLPAAAAPAALPAAASTASQIVNGAARALPVAGAALMGAPAIAEEPGQPQEPEPAPPPAPVNTSGAGTTDTLSSIAGAQTVDEAIAAAGEALADPNSGPARALGIDTAQLAGTEPEAAPAQQTALADAAAPRAESGPVASWSGRRGAGYITPEDALRALPSRQRADPDLDWRVEDTGRGTFVLNGYEREQGADGLAAAEATAVAARQLDSGNALVTGPEDHVRQYLAARGVTNFMRTNRGFMVARSQAPLAVA